MRKFLNVIISIMILSVVFCGCGKKQPTSKFSDKITSDTQKTQENQKEQTELTLYFATDNAMLKKVTVKTELGDKTPEEAVLEALMAGSDCEGIVSVIPSQTKINSVKTADGTCTVDLSGDFADGNFSGNADRTLAVYSIVNSLAELDGVENVQFLIDGEKQEIFGDFLFDEPFEADEALEIK